MNDPTMQLRREMREHALNFREAKRIGAKLFADCFLDLACRARNDAARSRREHELKRTLKARVEQRLRFDGFLTGKMAAANDR